MLRMNPLLQSSSALLMVEPASTFLVGLIRFVDVGPFALVVAGLLPVVLEVSLEAKAFLLLGVDTVNDWDFERGKVVAFELALDIEIN